MPYNQSSGALFDAIVSCYLYMYVYSTPVAYCYNVNLSVRISRDTGMCSAGVPSGQYHTARSTAVLCEAFLVSRDETHDSCNPLVKAGSGSRRAVSPASFDTPVAIRSMMIENTMPCSRPQRVNHNNGG